MRYVAAYLLAALGGNASPSEKDLKKILSSVGVEVDASSLKLVISELKGKSIEDVLAEGREKLASVPSGAAPAAATASSDVSAKKEEVKEESEEEGDADMGFGLFD